MHITLIIIKKFLHFFSPSIKISRKNINFEDKKINEINFYKNKKLFKIEDIDINNILVSKKESYGKKNSLKYFIGYNDDDIIRPLCVRLPPMIGYVKFFDSNNTMSFKVSDNNNLLSIIFDSEPVYGDNDKYIKTKIKLYGDKINTNFQSKKISKVNASYKCLSLIMLDSVIRANKKYYPETLLEECKYEIKKKKMENLINDDLNPSLSDESDNESDNRSDDEADD